MRRLAALILLLCGCSLRQGERLDLLFDASRADFRAGEFTKAQAGSERGVALAIAQRDLVYQWKFRLLRAEILLYTERAEEVLNQLAEPVPASPALAGLAARKRMLEGQAQSILRHSHECDTLLAEAQRDAAAANAEDVLEETENLRGLILVIREQYEDGERTLYIALDRARHLNDAFAEGSVLLNLGLSRLRKNRYDEAAAYFEQASNRVGPRARTLYSVAQSNLAVCYKLLGEYDRAIHVQLEAIARHEQSGAKFYLSDALGAAGELYAIKGDLRSAIPYLQKALSLATEMNRVDHAAVWADNLSLVEIELGNWRDAEAMNEESIRLNRSARSSTLYNLVNSARIAVGRKELDSAEMFYSHALVEGKDDPAVQWGAHGGLGEVARERGRTADAEREFESAIDQIAKTRAELRRTEFKLPFLARPISLYQEYVDALVAEGQVERALAVADSSHAQVLAESSGPASVRGLPAGAFAASARASGSTLISYWLAPAKSHAWVVTGKGVHHVPLPPAGEIEREVSAYQQAIEKQLADPMRTHIAAGEKLYEMLIAPIRPFLVGSSRVIVVPDGVLHGINLESLPVPGKSPHYWIQDVTLEIAPSLAMLHVTASDAGIGKRLLLLGDPSSNDSSFPPLAHAAREIASVKQNFPAADQVVLTRESATPQAYLAAASGPFAAIHFTAHATANRENPLESAVVLSGSKLYARDVMELKLNADLVTVSACRGAGQRTYSGEGLVGFAWAFLRAGARHVIAGLWDVNDQSTADLMEVLYQELAAGKRPAEALRAAKLTMIERSGNLRKPYYWAPFQLYTDTN
jgi:CHAT domain-containing protein